LIAADVVGAAVVIAVAYNRLLFSIFPACVFVNQLCAARKGKKGGGIYTEEGEDMNREEGQDMYREKWRDMLKEKGRGVGKGKYLQREKEGYLQRKRERSCVCNIIKVCNIHC
jgi:hypothetical protein